MPDLAVNTINDAISLSPKETLEAEISRHPIVLWVAYVKAVLLFTLPFLGVIFMVNTSAELFGNVPIPLLIVMFCMWAIILGSYVFWRYIDFQLDRWFVTNHRLIDVEQIGFFHRSVSSLHLRDVQDVTVTVNGFLASTLKFGHVRVQTAGTEREFQIKTAANPEKARDILLQTGTFEN